MVAAKQLSLAALLWLGLANQGLALGIDEATNDLTLMERSPALKAPIAKVIIAGHPASGPIHRLRDEEEELDTRDERDFEELDERDLDIETRRERPGHGPSHGPKKHRRDFEESDLETRSPRRAVPGGTRGSWGGQNGPRPRDIEARGPPVPGGGGRPRPIHSPHPHIGRDIEDVQLEARRPWKPSAGRRRPKGRDLEDVQLEARRSPVPGSGGRPRPIHSPRPHIGRDVEDFQLEARRSPVPGGGGRPAPRPIRPPKKHVRSLNVRMGGFGVTRGPRRPRPRSLQNE